LGELEGHRARHDLAPQLWKARLCRLLRALRDQSAFNVPTHAPRDSVESIDTWERIEIMGDGVVPGLPERAGVKFEPKELAAALARTTSQYSVNNAHSVVAKFEASADDVRLLYRVPIEARRQIHKHCRELGVRSATYVFNTSMAHKLRLDMAPEEHDPSKFEDDRHMCMVLAKRSFKHKLPGEVDLKQKEALLLKSTARTRKEKAPSERVKKLLRRRTAPDLRSAADLSNPATQKAIERRDRNKLETRLAEARAARENKPKTAAGKKKTGAAKKIIKKKGKLSSKKGARVRPRGVKNIDDDAFSRRRSAVRRS
jgi:hypothetical protein